MERWPIPDGRPPASWTRVALVVLRLAFLAFLIWVLVSAKVLVERPMAASDGTPGAGGPAAIQAASGSSGPGD